MRFPVLSAILLFPAVFPPIEFAQTESRLVDLNVVALNNHGQAVTDLTADDFRIVDAGKPQNISFFRERTRNEDSAQDPATPSPSNQFSNHARRTPPNATVILFDLLNMAYDTRAIAANELVRNLSSLKTAGSLYLYLLSVNGKYFAVHPVSPGEPPPSDRPGTSWTRQIKPLMDSGMRAVMSFRSPDIDVFVRTQLTFAALEALGEELSAIPGRKIIVWVTDGVPLALGENRSDTGIPIDFTPLIRRLSQVLERSNIALYPVRQIMLGRSDDIGADSGGAGATGGIGTGMQSLATLNLFADLTGGRRSTDKDIGGAVEQAMNDLNSYYQIGYDVPPGNWDDKFHKLRVTTTRRGVRLQAKSGYYAWRTAAGSRSEAAFTAIAAAPFDAEEIGLHATVSADPDDDDVALASVTINARDIALAQQGDRYTGHLRLLPVGYLPNGLIATGPITSEDLDYSAAQWNQARRDGIRVTVRLTKAQGASRFRVIVFDRGSNAVGSITIPAGALRPINRQDR